MTVFLELQLNSGVKMGYPCFFSVLSSHCLYFSHNNYFGLEAPFFYRVWLWLKKTTNKSSVKYPLIPNKTFRNQNVIASQCCSQIKMHQKSNLTPKVLLTDGTLNLIPVKSEVLCITLATAVAKHPLTNMYTGVS